MPQPSGPVSVAIVVSHPIQHFAPLYRTFVEQGMGTHVLFLSRAGLDIYYDSGFGIPVKWNNDVTDGYPHEFVADLNLGAERPRPAAFGQALARLHARLSELRPTSVVVYGYRHAYALTTLAWCRRHRVGSMMIGDSTLLGERNRSTLAVKRVVLPPLLRLPDAFLTIGDNNEDYLAHYGVPRTRMFRTPYPTDERELRAVRRERDLHRTTVRAELGIGVDDLVLLFAGKLVQRKRPLDIAGALRSLDERNGSRRDAPLTGHGRRAVAVLAGDGELRGRLEAEARDLHGALRLVGFADHKRLPRLYAAADVYVHPAEWDPHPLAIKEAVLSGLPVVTTDRVGSVGPSDDVRIGRNGLVYRVGDVEALANIIDELRCFPDRVTGMAHESEKVIPDIDMTATVDGFQAALGHVTGGTVRG